MLGGIRERGKCTYISAAESRSSLKSSSSLECDVKPAVKSKTRREVKSTGRAIRPRSNPFSSPNTAYCPDPSVLELSGSLWSHLMLRTILSEIIH